jgi:hypothetical protein
VPNLVALHETGEINLKEICGFEFPQGFWNRKRYKTLKKGPVVTGGGGGEIDNPISEDELDTSCHPEAHRVPDSSCSRCETVCSTPSWMPPKTKAVSWG